MSAKQQITDFLHAGKLVEAEKLCRDFLMKPGQQDSESWLLMAAIHANLGDIAQVTHCCLKAIDLDPQSVSAYFNLGIAQQSQGDVEAAISSYHKTLALEQSHSGAHSNLGMLLRNQRKFDDAIYHLDIAVRAQPHNPVLHYLLGNAHYQLGNTNDAEHYFRTAFELSPRDPGINNDLGNLLFNTSRTEEAITHFNTALTADPDSFIIHYNLSIALWRLGKNKEALTHCWTAIRLEPDSLPARQSLTQLISAAPRQLLSHDMWEYITETFHIQGVDSQLLVSPVIKHIQESTRFNRLIKSSSLLDTHSFTRELLSNRNLPILSDKLFLSLLSHAVITSFEFEKLLTSARKSFLFHLLDNEIPTSSPAYPIITDFLSALATQSFMNEYAYYIEPDEYDRLDILQEELHNRLSASGSYTNGLLWRILILASYMPLYQLQKHDINKVRNYTPLQAYAKEIITLQINNPEKEDQLAHEIPNLTAVTNNISRAVQEQYEESPYPRWANVTLHNPRRYQEVLGEIFPHADLPTLNSRPIEMLIAGCGTGKHPLQSATRFKDIHITAIDLSKASLSYAKRKAQEYGINNIDFYQADILQLENLNRTFHIIESIGVIHHMQDPARGLNILANLLVTGGLFNIGLYSTCARRDITAAREYLHDKGFRTDPGSIRSARKAIAKMDNHDPARNVLQINDFYTLSECRDLLFHVQEHTYNLTEIEQLIEQAGLEFIGFEFNDNRVKLQYQSLYPDDPDCMNLHNWDLFEERHKDTFVGMYTFWCKKK